MHIENWIQSITRLQLEKLPMTNPFKFVNDVAAVIKLNHLYRDNLFTACDNLEALRSEARQMPIDAISKIIYEECRNIGIIH